MVVRCLRVGLHKRVPLFSNFVSDKCLHIGLRSLVVSYHSTGPGPWSGLPRFLLYNTRLNTLCLEGCLRSRYLLTLSSFRPNSVAPTPTLPRPLFTQLEVRERSRRVICLGCPSVPLSLRPLRQYLLCLPSSPSPVPSVYLLLVEPSDQ